MLSSPTAFSRGTGVIAALILDCAIPRRLHRPTQPYRPLGSRILSQGCVYRHMGSRAMRRPQTPAATTHVGTLTLTPRPAAS